MSIIHLPTATIKLITSSQVITSVSSVVKELVENAIDGGGTNIDVKLDNNGLGKIEVKDDGQGINKADMKNVCLPSYTSKIKDFSDLDALQSYGFRGEALSSLCQISNVAITTRTVDDEYAMSYNIGNSGEVLNSKPSHHGVGTQIVVTNLFRNLPVRKQYLNSGRRAGDELKRVESMVKSLAVIHPGLRVTFCHNKCLVWQKTSVSTLKQAIMQAVGHGISSKLEELSNSCTEMCVKLLIPKKDCSDIITQSSADSIMVFVNKRPIRNKKMEKLLMKHINAYFEGQIPNKKYPHCLVSVELDASNLDINLEPNKTKVFFKEEDKVLMEVEKLLSSYYVTGMEVESTSNQREPPRKKAKVDVELSTTCEPTQTTEVKKNHFENDNYQIFFEECYENMMNDEINKDSFTNNEGSDNAVLTSITNNMNIVKNTSEHAAKQDRVRTNEVKEMEEYGQNIDQLHGHEIISAQFYHVNQDPLDNQSTCQSSNSLFDIETDTERLLHEPASRSFISFNNRSKYESMENENCMGISNNNVFMTDNGVDQTERVMNVESETPDTILNQVDKATEIWSVVIKPKITPEVPSYESAVKQNVLASNQSCVDRLTSAVSDSLWAEVDRATEKWSTTPLKPTVEQKNVPYKTSLEPVSGEHCAASVKPSVSDRMWEEADRATEEWSTTSPKSTTEQGNITYKTLEPTSSEECTASVKPSISEGMWEEVDRATEKWSVQCNNREREHSTKETNVFGEKEQWSRGQVKAGNGRLLQGSCVLMPTSTSAAVIPAALMDHSVSSQMGSTEYGSAFTKFSREIRPEILKEHPGIAFTKVAGMMVSRWRSLKAEEKARYKDMAREANEERKKIDTKPHRVEMDPAQKKDRVENFQKSLDKSMDMSPQNKPKPMSVKRKTIKRPSRKRQEIELSTDSLAEQLCRDRSTEQPDFSLIGRLKPSNTWLYRQGADIGIIRHWGLQETVLRDKLIKTFSVPLKVLDETITIDESNLEADLFQLLLSLDKSYNGLANKVTITSKYIAKNGFQIEMREGTDDLPVSCVLTAVPSVSRFYGVPELKETLQLLQAHLPDCTLELSRPLKIVHYIEAEAVRMTRESPALSRNELDDLLVYWHTHLNQDEYKCLHDKQIFMTIHNLNLKLSSSQEVW